MRSPMRIVGSHAKEMPNRLGAAPVPIAQGRQGREAIPPPVPLGLREPRGVGVRHVVVKHGLAPQAPRLDVEVGTCQGEAPLVCVVGEPDRAGGVSVVDDPLAADDLARVGRQDASDVRLEGVKLLPRPVGVVGHIERRVTTDGGDDGRGDLAAGPGIVCHAVQRGEVVPVVLAGGDDETARVGARADEENAGETSVLVMQSTRLLYQEAVHRCSERSCRLSTG